MKDKSYIVFYGYGENDDYCTHNLKVFDDQEKAIEYRKLCDQTLEEYQRLVTERDEAYSKYRSFTELYNSGNMNIYKQKFEEWDRDMRQQLNLSKVPMIYESSTLYFGIEEVDRGE